MIKLVGKDIYVEFPVYSSYTRSLRHRFGLGKLARGLNRFSARKLALGGDISVGHSGRAVIKALDGVSFEICEGDRVALLGRNGSGKTTLLRTLAGIYEPISGELTSSGRVAPLFDLQLGMDPDATGMENIWLRGKMLDLTNQQIDNSVEDVARFTELGDYLFMPIRTYSQGMLLRLAFGISTAVTPDILILDEMIGAGDSSFIDRANRRLKNFLEKTGILVIASHNPAVLEQWCNKGMLLEHGKIVAYGSLEETLARYNNSGTCDR
jgi:ABC-2 type transport system ATP-binding protein/lipopolysaccharide transport system ATP-binding protein